VFRVDHVLGMPAIAALPSLVGAVPPLPAGAEISQVSILWEETLALEGRAAFYDRAGALKDLLQNHLLQILCMITMKHRPTATPSNLSQRRLQALLDVQIPDNAQAAADSYRARYTAGQLAATGSADGGVVPDYAAEAGVDGQRQTETLAEVILRISSPEWAGTRFVLRAGKALSRRRRGILLDFTTGASTKMKQAWIDVDELPVNAPSALPGADAAHLGAAAPLEQIAYTRVLKSLLSGTFDLSVSALETERAWAIFAPFLAAWAKGDVPLDDYPAGSDVPQRRTR
jgi:glucose-6-phosphate 1-dehydrogenase